MEKSAPADNRMTKAQARRALGVSTDHQLAEKLGISHQAVSSWGGDDDPIPRQRDWQIRALKADMAGYVEMTRRDHPA